VLKAAHAEPGASFVEIYQNCIVYNDNVFGAFTDRDKATDAQIRVRHGEPLVFGADARKGLSFDIATMALEVVDAVAEPDRVLRHDETNATLAQLLLSMSAPEMPVALGVIYRDPVPSFEQAFYASHPTQMRRTGKVADALRQTNTWVVD